MPHTRCELALLGALMDKPFTLGNIEWQMKQVLPQYWYPSVTVVEGTANRAIMGNHVIFSDQTQKLMITPSGIERFHVLMATPLTSCSLSDQNVEIALRFQFLHRIEAEQLGIVFRALRHGLQQRLSFLEERTIGNRTEATFCDAWHDAERQRLKKLLKSIQVQHIQPRAANADPMNEDWVDTDDMLEAAE